LVHLGVAGRRQHDTVRVLLDLVLGQWFTFGSGSGCAEG
jgi:hypothetical protein